MRLGVCWGCAVNLNSRSILGILIFLGVGIGLACQGPIQESTRNPGATGHPTDTTGAGSSSDENDKGGSGEGDPEDKTGQESTKDVEVFEDQFKSSVTHEGQELSSKYSLVKPTENKGILLFLHGEGAANENPVRVKEISAIAAKHDLAAVAVASPLGNSWLGPVDTTNENLIPAAAYLNEFIDHLTKEHKMASNRIFLVGVSESSSFINAHFLPNVAETSVKGGGSILLCGGKVPVYRTAAGAPEFKVSKAFAKSHPIFAYIQKADKLFEQTKAGIQELANYGFPVKSSMPEGGSHCGFDLNVQIKGSLDILDPK